jgi:hypothetical protein
MGPNLPKCHRLAYRITDGLSIANRIRTFRARGEGFEMQQVEAMPARLVFLRID